MNIEEPKRYAFTLVLLIAGYTFPLLPHLFLAFKVLKDSEYGEILFGKKEIWQTLKRTERRLELCHHYCDLFIALHRDKDKAKHDYLVKKSQVYSKKALYNLLELTNGFIATLTFKSMSYKNKAKILKMVEEQLKNANGAIIVSFKGRVPIYVNDTIERVGKNLVLIKGSAA